MRRMRRFTSVKQLVGCESRRAGGAGNETRRPAVVIVLAAAVRLWSHPPLQSSPLSRSLTYSNSEVRAVSFFPLGKALL